MHSFTDSSKAGLTCVKIIIWSLNYYSFTYCLYPLHSLHPITQVLSRSRQRGYFHLIPTYPLSIPSIILLMSTIIIIGTYNYWNMRNWMLVRFLWRGFSVCWYWNVYLSVIRPLCPWTGHIYMRFEYSSTPSINKSASDGIWITKEIHL